MAVGIFWGVVMFIVTLLGYYYEYGIAFLEVMRSIYVVLTINPNGAIVGLCLGFLDGFIGTYVLISLYQFINNKLAK